MRLLPPISIVLLALIGQCLASDSLSASSSDQPLPPCGPDRAPSFITTSTSTSHGVYKLAENGLLVLALASDKSQRIERSIRIQALDKDLLEPYLGPAAERVGQFTVTDRAGDRYREVEISTPGESPLRLLFFMDATACTAADDAAAASMAESGVLAASAMIDQTLDAPAELAPSELLTYLSERAIFVPDRTAPASSAHTCRAGGPSAISCSVTGLSTAAFPANHCKVSCARPAEACCNPDPNDLCACLVPDGAPPLADLGPEPSPASETALEVDPTAVKTAEVTPTP